MDRTLSGEGGISGNVCELKVIGGSGGSYSSFGSLIV